MFLLLNVVMFQLYSKTAVTRQ